MYAYKLVRQSADLALGDEATRIEDREALGNVADEIEILFDKQNRAVTLLGNAL